MFKIGNSKELPKIPEHLSDDGKDFIRCCLQREPSNRPTSAELLQHPFVKNAASLEKSMNDSEPPEWPTCVPCGANIKVLLYIALQELHYFHNFYARMKLLFFVYED